ncbi:MAG TPA: UDP-N-acetylglucosamine diphosphorylase/glucosamine-1-phosphate N-acetyltransferase [Gallionella sp.]|nr:MAG: UDP-N-acetylglucosamine diphosphorylase/glucosamine-1-phosphate N-acetyltransferase [Gallionellales bacterium GWA2_54_124]OGT18575.1 MAG: UDP-N-acetylglucosamine diphosphorylase/glucosamine-1-phosphate N-acetyltransferase [Gallionellales bacterium RIFOXYD12_FULL_53_10]OGT24848.1 MAG: UDP-N-acetylglucosamine diphosphorylase/glucosamine-1-phosphate N-acetyltransferase [Gallionellales bacterium RIFOXYD2_FULL_52_7]HCI54054.1 UDP-N-acetylglucosamine diphosphorylase/glucosamine-1-phosphate N-a
MSSLNIVILAAGKGTRMYSDKPKVLHALAGKSLVGRVLECAQTLAPQQIIVIYGHGGEAVPAALNNMGAEFALQEPQLGTGHAVQQAMPLLNDDSQTLVLYGDVPLIQHSTLHQMRQAGAGLTLLTVNMDNPTGYGRIVRNAQGEVTAIIEQKDATEDQLLIREVNTGILLAPTRDLRRWLAALRTDNAQGEYYLTDIVGMAVADGIAVHTTQPGFDWEVHGVNSKSQLAVLERTWQQVEAQRLLAHGVTLADPARLDVRGTLVCGRDVEIDVGCIFEGAVNLGSNVQIGAYCIIKNATIAEGTQVAPYSHIDSSTVGADCRIGPYARIRPGSTLEADVHVGNFVEIKNSAIDKGSKANHLSYIGDTSIGRRVNIGAGTITCNYDGANKFRTIIEDDVFIGSDTQLVAPVTIAKGSTIGAGSTITRNTPEGELTLSRSKQMTISGWTRPVKKSK